MPKDIRSFFSGSSKSGTSSKAPESGKSQSTASAKVPVAAKAKESPAKAPAKKDTPAKKKSKYFDGDDAAPAKPAVKSPSSKAAAKAPAAQVTKPSPAATKKPPQRGKSKGKAIVLDSSDDEDNEEAADDPDASEESAEMEVDLGDSSEADASDEDDEVTVQPKKQRTGGSRQPTKAKSEPAPARTAARKVPQSMSKPAAQAAKTPAPAESKVAPKKPAAKRTPKAKEPEADPETKAALAAVEAAAQKLPDETALQYSVMEDTGGGYGTKPDDDPPNYGQKDMPRGHSECLKGRTFVITGVLDSLKRGQAEDFIKRHSGRVTGSISSRTSFLVVGLNCGRSKTNQAKDRGTKLIDEDGLFSLVAATKLPSGPPQPQPTPSAPQQPSGGSTAAPKAAPRGAASGAGPSTAATRSAGKASTSAPAGDAGSQLWVEKHKPASSKELVGNGTLVATLRQWLQEWDNVHLRGKEPAETKGRGKPRDLSKKAVLLSGPPGIGKTSSALILARELGFQAVEVNASDTRNKADASAVKGIGGKLSNSLHVLSTNASLGGPGRKVCLIMDEVDGMSGGDRGGVADLIKTIARSKVPIITICNDKYNQKLRSLRNHTLELDFRKPTRQQVAKRMAGICAAEGLAVNETALEALCEGANADIRLVLGQLQMIRLRARTLSYDEVKAKAKSGKDADMSPFEAARKLLSLDSRDLHLGDRTELVFQDSDLVPLLIQENYLNHRPASAQNDLQRMRAIAKAADSLSQGDLVNKAVRIGGNWGLMPFGAIVGSVMPATYMRGMRETFGLYPNEPNFPRFSAWFGNNSTSGKQRRLLGELHTRMAACGHFSADRTGLRTEYLPTLRQALTKPLVELEKEGIQPVVSLMQEYCLARDDLEFVTDVTKFKTKAPWGNDPFKDVPTQVKSAFTRSMNSTGTRPRTGSMVEQFKRGRKKGAAAAAPAEDEGPDDPDPEKEADMPKRESPSAEEQQEEEEEEDGLDPAAAAKKAKQLARKGITFSAKESPKGKGKSSGRGGAAKSSGRGRSGASSSGKSSAGRGAGRAGRGRGKA